MLISAIPASGADCARFSQTKSRKLRMVPRVIPQQFLEKQRTDWSSNTMPALIAQILLHTAVNELHSTETKADADSFFLLTLNLEGVKP